MGKMVTRLQGLPPTSQEYYHYLAHGVFSEFSMAQRYVLTYDWVASAKALFRCAELFWKALTILSGQFFEKQHELAESDMNRIANDLLPPSEKAAALSTLSRFSEARRQLAIYGYYEKGRSVVSPFKSFEKREVKRDVEAVEKLVIKFRQIHYDQVFSAKVRVGVLSGYVERAGAEIPCSEYTWSSFKKKDDWVADLNKFRDNQGSLFDAQMLAVRELPTARCSIVVNPFGETFPEKGGAQGPAFSAICEYIRNGGIFVSCAGNPFNYVWDVSASSANQKTIVSSFPVVTGLEVKQRAGVPRVFLLGTTAIPSESLLLSRTFGVSVAWDDPGKGVHGPVEVEGMYSGPVRVLKNRRTLKLKAFRPMVPSRRAIPLLRATHRVWGEVWPIALVPFGWGFLICSGTPLQNRPEYDRLVRLLAVICRSGFRQLVRYHPSDTMTTWLT